MYGCILTLFIASIRLVYRWHRKTNLHRGKGCAIMRRKEKNENRVGSINV